MTSPPINSILICGAGLASWMTAAALSRNLPASIEITVLETPNSNTADIFYGTVTSPTSYDFYLNLGLTEADLMMKTQSSFSYGTRYKNWGLTNASWTQCFHSPFPSWNGVPFSHHLSRGTESLEHYLVSAQAAANGRFAHTPKDKTIALASAEYGYHIKAGDITPLMKRIAMKNGVSSVSQQVDSVDILNGEISGLSLDNGQVLSADIYIDASGPDATLLSSLGKPYTRAGRRLGALYSERQSAKIGAPLRYVASHDFGWQSLTSLQGTEVIMTVFDPKSEEAAHKAHPEVTAAPCEVSLGHRSKPWSGNCVALGHAAAIVEPTSPAPIMLLQMDIQRLQGLIPVSADFDIEAKIFNDSFHTDVDNIQLFNDALFQIDKLAKTPYWSSAKTTRISQKLDRKLKQFSRRGLLVSYDLEPFNDEDWTILHHGTGRKPRKKDTFAALSDAKKISQELRNKANSIQEIVTKMPPHHSYMAKYLNYLERNHVSEL